jgi:hypothetical protein
MITNPGFKAIVIATIFIIASIASLVIINSYWEMIGWVGLWIYSGIMIGIGGLWILLMGKTGIEKSPLKNADFAIIAMFAALLMIIDAGSMFVPGLSVLWYIAPMFAAPILSYFPMGIALAAALKLSPKPGAAFTLFIVYQIIGQILFFNPIWLARSILLALAIEAYYISSKRGTTIALALMGLMFGIVLNTSAGIFQIYNWGFWQPIFLMLPEAILSGVLMVVGTFLGSAVAERAKSVMF